MRLLVIDQDRVGLDICQRAAAAGHEVKWFRFCKRPCKDGEGFKGIEIITDWRREMPWAKDGLIMTTVNGKYLYELDRWRDFGYKNILAPTVASANLEINRGDGMKVFEQAGHSVPTYQTFSSLQDAKKYVIKTDQNYCFKPMGDCEDKAVTFTSSNPAQMCEWLDSKIKSGWNPCGDVMLQDKIDFIGEIGIAGYMGPNGFLEDKYEISFEHKKLCSGNYGPSTGEMATVTCYVKSDPLVDILKSLENVLLALGHRGDFAIGGCIDDKGKFQFFEFTARQGWPDAFIRTSMNKGDPIKWMKDMLDGKDTLKVSYDPHMGIVCAQRPFPYSEGADDEVIGKPIYGLEEVWDDVHPVQIYKGKGYTMTGGTITTGELYRTSGNYPLVVTGSGKDVKTACANTYNTLGEVKLSDMICRDDIGEDVQKELPQLHKYGYAKAVE